MNDMENDFQSDIIGYLEFVSQANDKETDQHHKVLLESIQQTLEYHNNIQQAKEVLHKVLFNDWNRREFHHVDFDVPKFKRGVTTLEYLDIVIELHMETLAITQLFSMSPKTSIPAIQQLLLISHNTALTHRLLITFIKIMIHIEIQDDYNSAMDYLSNYRIENTTLLIISTELSNVLDVYNQQLNNASITDKVNIWKNMNRIVNLLVSIVTRSYKDKTAIMDRKLSNITKKLKSIESRMANDGYKGDHHFQSFYQLDNNSHDDDNNDCIPVKTKIDTQTTIIQDWKSTTNNSSSFSKQELHEQAFIIICHHLKMNSFSFQPVDTTNKEKTLSTLGNLQRLSDLLSSKNATPFIEAQYWCVSMLTSQCGLWQSVLKVIVQFMDLWIGFIQESKTGGVFALLIANQNRTSLLYKNILKHVRHYNQIKTPVIFNMIKSSCLLLEQCLDVCSIHDIQALRDDAFFNGYSNENITLPTLGTVDFWYLLFDNEITKIGNQITTFEDMEDSIKMNDVLTRKLNLLSFIWPYKVVQELFLLCVNNKNQHKVIIPILRHLGQLVHLSNNGHSLLLAVIKETLNGNSRIEEHMGNITQFVKACCHLELDYPLILAPPLVVAQSCTALLDIQAFFQDCLLQNLQTFYNNRNMLTIRASLQLLVSLFQDDHWLTSVHRARRDGLAILLYSQPETLAECLTDMLYLRHGTSVPQGFRLQDWELILTLVGKVSDVARYALDTFAPLNGFLKSLENKDWKTRLLWYDLSSHIPELKQPISVPDSLYRLTGEMNGLFVSDQNKGGDDQSKTIGWIHLFDACKLSRTLIDTLFINHEKWMYNLILLWKHPNEDDIIGPCFREILHPKLNFSVSIEYPILLVDFIGRLADTFHIQKTIIDYYIQKDDVLLLKFISKLSEQATKQFFQVLYIIRLLRDEAKEGKELDTENTYYISSLIKTLQGLTNWGMLCKVHYFETQPAYTKMKSILIPVNTSTFDRHPLTLGDNINPGTGTAAEQPSKVIHTFYPLFNEHAISCRALALLTFCLLCEVCGQFESQEARDMVRRQVLQLVEGFVDLESRIYFDKLVKQQPKNRIAKWKKAEHTKIQMSLRPVLSEEEENLVTSHLTSLYDSEKNGILQALDLTESHKEKENSGPKLLYFS